MIFQEGNDHFQFGKIVFQERNYHFQIGKMLFLEGYDHFQFGKMQFLAMISHAIIKVGNCFIPDQQNITLKFCKYTYSSGNGNIVNKLRCKILQRECILLML